ncbi:MAG: lysozyme [Proteobacteria bacterium]|nr:lysozyme [Pseudomonadota bacterium]
MKLDLSIIKESEGYSKKAYHCPKGVLTIGWGSTYRLDGSRVKSGDLINEELAERMLHQHIQKEIIDRLDQDVVARLKGSQLSALCSLIYRVGITAFDRSMLKQHILRRNYKSINNNWDWLGDNPQIHRGLCLRVSREKAMFFSEKLK